MTILVRKHKKSSEQSGLCFNDLEQATGVGPASKAWEAFILPMNYACVALSIADGGQKFKVFSVEPAENVQPARRGTARAERKKRVRALKLTGAERSRFAETFLRTMDLRAAAASIGRGDGAALLGRKDVQRELVRQRESWAGQLGTGDIRRRIAAIAFGPANDCVRLALDPDCDLDSLDLTLLSELKRSEKGVVEVKLCDRLAALEYLDAAESGKTDPAADFLAALSGEEDV